jgi:hypothetical protein
MRPIPFVAIVLCLLATPATAQVRPSSASSGPPPTLSSTGPGAPDGTEGPGGAADGGSVLWDQTDFGPHGWLDQVFTDLPTSSGFQVNDVSTGGETWKVTKVTTYFTKGHAGTWTPGSITTGNLQVFPKTGALPAASDLAPEHVVPVTLVADGTVWRVEADTSGIAELACITGEFWIGLTPITNFAASGQEYHWVTPVVGAVTAFRNPGGAFGLGSGWLSLSAIDMTSTGPPYEASITLEGEVLPDTWVSLGDATALLSQSWGDLPVASGAGIACTGSTVTLSVSHCGPPFGVTTLVVGLSNMSLPFKGGTMVPSNNLLLSFPTGATGNTSIPFAWPLGLPPGFKIYLQFWQNEPPWSASNGLEVTAL